MAAQVTLRNSLIALGFSQEAATYIVNDQGYDSPAEFARLTEDEASNLCYTTRKPGGLQANGDPNRGITVTNKAENNLKLLCFHWRYQQRVSRTLAPQIANMDVVRRHTARMRLEKSHEDPSAPEIETPVKNWSRTIDVIEDYLRNCLGTTKIPLAYVIREQRVPDTEANDPPANYETYTEELIARAPHYEPGTQVLVQTFKDDNVLVFNKLAEIFRDKDCWTYMQSAARRYDGRMAFLNLKNHYLGENNVDNLANAAERQLQKTTYVGEGRRWNFEKYVRTHVDQHQILEDLTRHGYSGIDARSKVRYLMDGIKTKDLDNVKTTIMASATLRSDFDACVNLFQDFIKQASDSQTRHANVSSVTRPGRGQGGPPRSESNAEYDNIKPDMSVADRYYNRSEYAKLTAAQKKGLSLKRKQRGHKSGAKDSKRPQKAGKSFKKRVVSAVKSYLAQNSPSEEKENSDSDEEVPMKDQGGKGKEKSNRTNDALKRKGT